MSTLGIVFNKKRTEKVNDRIGLRIKNARRYLTVYLENGFNAISEKDYEFIKQHPLFIQGMDEGFFEVVSESSVKESKRDIPSLNATSAKKLINQTEDVLLLKKALDEEKRSTIRKVIEDRLTELEGKILEKSLV